MAKNEKYTYKWPRPMVTVDAAVFAFINNKTRILLIKRGKEPFKGKWALPGGFIGIDEELQDAVSRELFEETGLENIKLQQLHTFGKCGRDPRGRQITIVFWGVAAKGFKKIKAGDDASSAKWFDLEKLPQDLAFDHEEVIDFAEKKLKLHCRKNFNRDF